MMTPGDLSNDTTGSINPLVSVIVEPLDDVRIVVGALAMVE